LDRLLLPENLTGLQTASRSVDVRAFPVEPA
jgi:hypothetical protein